MDIDDRPQLAAAVAWLDENWDPTLTVGEWWQRLADASLATPSLPPPWGRGWTTDDTIEFARAAEQRGVLPAPGGIGMVLAAPTLIRHASAALVERLLPSILNGRHGWCQLFSEPNAGSDLAAVQTRAVRDGDDWVVTGQKVWTTGGQWADYGLLIARTDPDQPKNKGLTYFVLDMLQPGVDVRPLREMNGHADFNEVFIDGARVPHGNVVGEINGGWAVVNTTLTVERGGKGGASSARAGAAVPGTITGHLAEPAGPFVDQPPALGSAASAGPERVTELIELARALGCDRDPLIRQGLAQMYSVVKINEWHVERMRSGAANTGGEGNIAKLRNSELFRLAREIGCAVLGPHATLMGTDALSGGSVQDLIVFSPGPSIYGGTSQIQRNILGERVLGLPKEPDPGHGAPFRTVLQNRLAGAGGQR
jgi:alkylation response protein AidB-like acyl-CoA dehydrogenase